MSVEIFVARARELRTARDLVKDDAEYSSATALLAVHSALSLNDALLVQWTGKWTKGSSHQDAVNRTDRECNKRRIETTGLKHLRSLISEKSDISYGNKRVSHSTALGLAEAAKRFEAWAFKNCKEIVLWDR